MIINFDRLGQGGGSGSGYTLPIASEQVLGGVKIGSGITIDSGGTISVEGGQGGGDYMVVSELPASAETGQLFYVPEHSSGTSTTLSGWEIFDEAENDSVGFITDDEEINIELNTGEGGDFRLNDEWIGTSNTFREMRGINGQLDVVAKCDGQGHCWIYVITPGNFHFDNMSMEETTTVEDSTYDYHGEIVPAATYRYLDGQFVLVPEGSLVHLRTLSGATGETNVVYECDGQLFYWNSHSGATGIWSEDMVWMTDGSNKDHYYMGLSFSTIPENTVLMSGITHAVYSGEKWNIVYSGGNIVVETVEGTKKVELYVGETWSGKTSASGVEVWVAYEPHYIGIACYGTFKAYGAWNGQANGAHWELVNKETWPYTPKDYDGIMSPDKKGRIHHKKSELRTKGINLNGSTIGTFYTKDNTSATNIYAPTTSGTTGQVLIANGNAAPMWATLIKSVKITSAAYDALVQAGTTDPNTLYLIDDE